MKTKTNDKQIESFIDVICETQDYNVLEDFLLDICSVSELRAMAQRYEIAKMLLAGYVISDIIQKTGANTATISKVKTALSYGNGQLAKFINEKG